MLADWRSSPPSGRTSRARDAEHPERACRRCPEWAGRGDRAGVQGQRNGSGSKKSSLASLLRSPRPELNAPMRVNGGCSRSPSSFAVAGRRVPPDPTRAQALPALAATRQHPVRRQADGRARTARRLTRWLWLEMRPYADSTVAIRRDDADRTETTHEASSSPGTAC
jgi:hypothetical protein